MNGSPHDDPTSPQHGQDPPQNDRSTAPIPINRANPSRKTGRSGKVDRDGLHARFPELRPPERVDPDLPVPTADMPRKGVRVARRRRLLRIAGAQDGLFTVAQAASAGLDRRARHHHLTYGNWRRTDAPDVLRLAGWPPDAHERLRSWLLWAGPGALLTSWTALGLAGLTALGPRMPVDLEVPFGRNRAGQRRRQRLLRQLSASGSRAEVHLLPAVDSRTSDLVSGLAVRQPAEAICAAINHGSGSIAAGVTMALLEQGHLTDTELLTASMTVGCPGLNELLFRHWAS